MELDRVIRSGRLPNCTSFAGEWEVSPKTVQRDFDFLRDDMGAPLEYDAGRRGYRFGHCHTRGEVRQFAIARVGQAELTDATFRVPGAFRAADRLSSAFARYAAAERPTRVRLRFVPAAEKWVADCLWHPSQKLTRRRDGSIDLTFKVTGLLEVKRWILSWGPDVRVLAPAGLRREVEDDVRRMAENVKTA